MLAVYQNFADTRTATLEEAAQLTANAGDTATVPTGVWHGFKNAGEGRLRILCIHASDVIIQTWADEA